jgi:metalloendopeptidase OMA1, mitochondrial
MCSFRWHPALAMALVAVGVVTACETVPYTGRPQLQFMSPQQESELGAQAYQQTLAKTKLSSDAAASQMVTRVGSRIAAVTGHPEYKWEYRLIQGDKQVNAFALPGGKVAVYTGILPITRVGVLLPWSRVQESEADHLGLILMAKAGYDPHAARDLRVRMAAASKGSGKPAESLSTHPSEPTRIQQIEVWMAEAMQHYHPR